MISDGFECQGPRNRHPLGLPAGELARAPRAVSRRVQADEVEQLLHAPAALRRTADAEGDQRLLD